VEALCYGKEKELVKTIEEVLTALDICANPSYICDDGCPYSKEKCEASADAAEVIRQFADENRAMKAELKVNFGNKYWMNICRMNARQESKGMEKYGEPLEENTTLTTTQRIEHLQEELIDALKYCEHLKVVSNDGITANDYQRAAMRTAGDDTENYLLNGVMGLCGESGEVIDLVKKHLFQGHELDKKQLALECGDCAWYLALIASATDMPFGEVLQMNIDKLKERYPTGFSKDRSINRKE
jgi:NTP pyrophosphatase (non-canonical NTP hydrolase)